MGPLKAFSKEGIAVIVQAAVFTVADMDDLLIREGERLGSIWYVLQGMVARQQSRAEPAEKKLFLLRKRELPAPTTLGTRA